MAEEKTLWTAAPSSTSIWEQTLEFRSGKHGDNTLSTLFYYHFRKLYEQDLFPGAPIIPLFEKYFGKYEERDFSEVCSVGWEPNPGHASYLAELESHYRDCGYRLTINTLTGVGVTNRQGQFARLKQVRHYEVPRFVI